VVRILVAVELEAVVVVEGEEAAVAVVAVDGWVSTNVKEQNFKLK
jgi:hypothetical protein